MARPQLEQVFGTGLPKGAELSAYLEHATIDVRAGRAAPLAKALGGLAKAVTEPETRERVLGLWAEAALQAGQLDQAATAEAQREALVGEGAEQIAIRLRRIGLAGALGRADEAAVLADPLVKGGDSRVADEARLRLVGGQGEKELRAWIALQDGADAESARRAGMAALRLLGDVKEAERLLAPLETRGPCDPSLCEAMAEVYGRLDRPAELARVLTPLLQSGQLHDSKQRARAALQRAEALGRAGDVPAALAALEPIRRGPEPGARRAARRARYELLRKSGLLRAEVASLRDPAERAFVALEIERNYAEAVRLYGAALQAQPDSLELTEGLAESERRRELSERRALYEQVLAKEPEDHATREKLLATLVALGEVEEARQWVGRAVQGREASAEVLLAGALMLRKAGLARDAAGYLERAHAAEKDEGRRQQILFALGELYAGAQNEEMAHRLYSSLAANGASAEIRERAVARLAAMLK